MKTKHVVIGVSILAVAVVTIFILKNKKKTTSLPASGSATVPSTATPGFVASTNSAVVEQNNWDDMGGYRVQQPSTNLWNYYRVNGKFAGADVKDANGDVNYVTAAA